MKLKRSQLLENIGFDMTPMIDCVFQLIIFFMLTTDFANTQLERLTLPRAITSVEDTRPKDTRLMINLAHDPPDGKCKELKYDDNARLLKACTIESHWKIKVKGQEYNPAELEAYLRVQGNLYEGREASPDGGKTQGLSNRPLMIRADAGAVYKILEKVFAACARARLWKIEIGASKPPESE